MHINDLRKTLASIDGRLRELAPTKPAWDRLIERCDDLRCGDCNQHVASDSLEAALLAASISLENLLDLVSVNTRAREGTSIAAI
jgi:hypothetical protein